MAWHYRSRQISAIVVATGIVGALGSSASAEMTVTGDPTIWAEVRTALTKLNQLSGYRVRMTGPGGRAMGTVEVSPQENALHMTMQSPWGTAETVQVGDDVRTRINKPGAPSEWQCPKQRGRALSPFGPGINPLDPRNEGIVEAVQGEDTTINGSPVRSYTYTITRPGDAEGLKTIIYVDAQSGLPLRTVQSILVDVGVYLPFTSDFFDFGSKIDIILPPCTQSVKISSPSDPGGTA